MSGADFSKEKLVLSSLRFFFVMYVQKILRKNLCFAYHRVSGDMHFDLTHMPNYCGRNLMPIHVEQNIMQDYIRTVRCSFFRPKKSK